MANYPPPYPPPGPPYGNDWKYQRHVMKEQARLQRDMLRAQQYAYRQQLRGMRRGSIVGPLLVIVIGIVFLLVQMGHISGHDLWLWYGRWWPALLVGAGLVMLLEWAFDQYMHSGETPLPRRSIGGGVFTLLLLFGLAGIFVSGVRDGRFFGKTMNFDQDNLDQFMGDKHESDQTLSQEFPVGTALWVDNPRGDISVSGTSDDNQIHVSVHKQVYTRSDSEADNKAQQLSPNLTKEGTMLSLKLPSVEGGRADLVITVPAAAATTLSANHGDIRVSQLKAPATVTANHGDVDLSGITGAIGAHINNGDSSFSAHSVTGQVTVEGRGRDLTLSDISGSVNLDGEFFGTTHLERVRDTTRFHTSRTDFRLARLDGEVEISPNADLSTNQAVGPLTLTTRNRNITLERISGDISIINRNGSVDLTAAPPLGNITIENRNGSVNVTVPEQADFTVQAETTNGDVENDFSLSNQENDNRKTFGGTVGKGGSLIRITTSQGDIALKKASVAPLPPTPPPPPPLSIHSSDGSSVIIGKNGINITSGSDGSRVVVNKNGARISSSEGAHTYTENNGTTLTTSPDGTTVYTTHQGDKYTSTPDGTKTFSGRDGTRITISPDGTKVGIGPGGKALSNSEIDSQLRRVEAEIRKLIDQHKDH
ncbi:MAG TPA: DUF4097 family beta strand repeat-containing protein [Edaphobacter sp.]